MQINFQFLSGAIKNDSFFSTNIDQKDFNNDDFVDIGHFSPKGAKKFAKLIYPEVLKCLNSSNSFLKGSLNKKVKKSKF